MARDWRRRPLPLRAAAYARLPLQAPLVVSALRVAFAEDTVEEQVARVMVERLAVSSATAGADTGAMEEVARLLDADWLPGAALTDG